ncbi:AMP-binding protein [Cellulomonas persica]|uniref:AMP-binding protein n=1 Tax=Cellulomonas persica TaxID=76861 RepID=UPI001FEFEDCC|nr:AMP-binding protein [Cellulomonas persica]
MSRPLRDVAARVDLLLDLLRPALDGTGPALRVTSCTPGSGAARTADEASDDRARDDEVPDDVALVVATSGSTGEPRAALLTAAALRASGLATERRLSGPGRWLLALPVDHVAGLQVLVRSVLAGTRPAVVAGAHFTPDAFTAAVATMTDDERGDTATDDAATADAGATSSAPGGRPAVEPAAGPAVRRSLPRYVSLVPTQLVRILDDDAATAAARTFDAILLGGAAAAAPLLARARDAGLRVVTTYGMTETCGGCVYDGVPLDGVQLRLDDDGRVLLGGDVLAAGYLGRPDLDATTFVERDGTRYLRTSDLGRIDDDRLTVLGRADDVVVTGGVNVAPAAVEAALATLPGVAEALVVGVPDDEWGQAVAALVVLDTSAAPSSGATSSDGRPSVDLATVRAHVASALGAPFAPRHLVVVDALPLRGPGKPDRRTARTVVETHLASSTAQPTSSGSPA